MNDTQPPSNPQNSQKPKRSWSDLGPRLISASVLLAVTIFMVWIGGIWFSLMVGVIFAGVLREWETMLTSRPVSPLGLALMALLGFVSVITTLFGIGAGFLMALFGVGVAFFGSREHRIWRTSGHLFFSLVIIALISIRGESSYGFAACFFLGTSVWMTDTGAFFAGRHFGGAKLNPEISPAKTWSGAFGGLIAGSLAGLAVWMISTPSPWWIGIIIAALISLSGQIGDLSESAIKRWFRIKDSGDSIPGHGGLMDRLDSLTFGALLVFAIGAWHFSPMLVANGLLLW